MMDEVIDDLRFDAKHSFEDVILPVEAAYDRWGSRLALLGGMDLDFLCRADLDAIHHRCVAMLERTRCRGFALGTGNSVPEYLPQEAYFAVLAAGLEVRW